MPTIADFLSGMSAFDADVYATDRNNSVRTSISTAVTSVQPDWDIDRSGSKSSVAIETRQPVLTDGMWIAPYIKITPEVGDITEQQMGHFRLATPGAMIDGSVDYDGAAKVVQTASGADIVDDLARARLAETFYTPVGGHVMQDVSVLIQMATCGVMGPNLLANHSFEQFLTGWGGPYWDFGAAGNLDTWYLNYGVPTADGEVLFAPYMNAGVPDGADVNVNQQVTIPAGTQYLYLMGVGHRFAPHDEPYLHLQFSNEGNTIIGNHPLRWITAQVAAYTRQIMVAAVPPGAVYARVYVGITRRGAGMDSTKSGFDDIRLGTCTSMPLPATRISLPPSTAVASTRIQTTSGKSYAYDAINADRLAAIGHHALYTTLDGRLTSSPVRDVASATPSRQYGRDDYRLVGTVETERSATNRHNHYIAIKEDSQNAANTLVANAYNNDPDDPWSILNMALSSADPIMVQDAVDLAALQAVADAALARSSEQEILRIQVLPDPALTVHSVIEIVESALPEAVGKWLVESITPGMSADNPLVEIGARRTRRAGGSY